MDLVYKGLYLGALEDAVDVESLENAKITHVLTVDLFPIDKTRQSPNIAYKFIKIMDNIDFDILNHFDECYNFIDKVITENGVVFVHCRFGVSRSSTVVAAYLMKKLKLTVEDSIAEIRKSRPGVEPNPGFMDQLGLYEKMNCSANNSNALYRLYQLGILVDHSKPAHHWDSISTLLHEDNTSGTIGKGVKCRNCRKVLFSQTSIVTHNDPQGQLCLRQNGCSGVVYVAPLMWMSEMIGEEHGKIYCPGCRTKIGGFQWSGSQCQCRKWVTPSFHVHANKIDKPML